MCDKDVAAMHVHVYTKGMCANIQMNVQVMESEEKQNHVPCDLTVFLVKEAPCPNILCKITTNVLFYWAGLT